MKENAYFVCIYHPFCYFCCGKIESIYVKENTNNITYSLFWRHCCSFIFLFEKTTSKARFFNHKSSSHK